MNEAFRLGLNDTNTMEEIVLLNQEKLQYKSAREALEYEMCTIGGVKNNKRLNMMFKEVSIRIRKFLNQELRNETL